MLQGTDIIHVNQGSTIVHAPTGQETRVHVQVETMLSTADNWDFDAMEMDSLTNGHALSVLGYWLLHTTGLSESMHLDRGKLVNFLHLVECGYSKHNVSAGLATGRQGCVCRSVCAMCMGAWGQCTLHTSGGQMLWKCCRTE